MNYYHDTIVSKQLILITTALSIGTLLLGCRSSSKNPGISKSEIDFLQNASKVNTAPPTDVALLPGDEIDVKFFYTPDLNESQKVRPDGKIALQLIGEVEAEGKTPAELREELLGLYSSHLKKPEIIVLVRLLCNRRVFVGGQVMNPGIVEMPGNMTVLEAIMQAGGFDMREAKVQNVVVIRHINGQRYGYSINLKPALVGDETQPFYLLPQDIVYVPRTLIAKLDQWVDQHVNKIIPDTGFRFTRTLGRSTIGMGSYR